MDYCGLVVSHNAENNNKRDNRKIKGGLFFSVEPGK